MRIPQGEPGAGLNQEGVKRSKGQVVAVRRGDIAVIRQGVVPAGIPARKDVEYTVGSELPAAFHRLTDGIELVGAKDVCQPAHQQQDQACGSERQDNRFKFRL